eukprot:852723-Heterocapsa_arctica.AAC.1
MGCIAPEKKKEEAPKARTHGSHYQSRTHGSQCRSYSTGLCSASPEPLGSGNFAEKRAFGSRSFAGFPA